MGIDVKTHRSSVRRVAGVDLAPHYPFPPDIYMRVRAQIETGLFESGDDVIREAIDSLEKRHHGLEKIRVMV